MLYTFVFQMNIYMTHLSNYGNDRLALYTFESVIKFVQCWTNLRLKQGSPMDHAIRYFDMFPDEETPLWRVSLAVSFLGSKQKASARVIVCPTFKVFVALLNATNYVCSQNGLARDSMSHMFTTWTSYNTIVQ